jgi:hypothetical protein
MTSLLKCPFCGATPHQGLGKKSRCQLHGDESQGWKITCPHGCAGLEMPSRELAMEKWNTRCASPVTGQAQPVVTDENRDLIYAELAKAYENGCRDVHDNYVEDRDPDFKEAAYDYATAQTEAVLKSLTSPPDQSATAKPVAITTPGQLEQISYDTARMWPLEGWFAPETERVFLYTSPPDQSAFLAHEKRENAKLQVIIETLTQVITETAGELGCRADNEAILQAIRDKSALLKDVADVLEPFAKTASVDISGEEEDEDTFQPMSFKNRRAGPITVGHFRRARTLLAKMENGQ